MSLSLWFEGGGMRSSSTFGGSLMSLLSWFEGSGMALLLSVVTKALSTALLLVSLTVASVERITSTMSSSMSSLKSRLL